MLIRHRLSPLISFLLPLLFVTSAAAGDVDHYDIALSLNPDAGTLRADVVVTLTALEPGSSALRFCLNNRLEVESADIVYGVSSLRRDESGGEGCPFAPSATPLVLSFDRPVGTAEEVALHLSYEGGIEMDVWTTNRLTPAWTELGLYSAWFPRFTNRGTFTYSLDLTVDSRYTIAGTGDPTYSEGVWHLAETAPTFDIVVMASPTMRRSISGVGGAAVVIYHSGLDVPRVHQLGRDVERILRDFGNWFGETSAPGLTIALAPRSLGGGYARPSFIVMSYYPDSTEYRWLVKSLAHEIAHFWWSGAPSTSWEDWMNEAFAEYASLMFVRDLYGTPVLNEYLDEYRQNTVNRPPIRGIERFSEHAYFVLYCKGALILNKLEQRLGRDGFRALLHAMVNEKIHSTEAFLAKLEELNDPETRAWMEEELTR